MPADGAELRRRLGAPAELENVIGALLELGVSEDAISVAYKRGRIEDAIFDPVLETTRERRTVTPVDIERSGGPAVAETQLLALNFGLRAPEPEEPFFTPEEGAALRQLGELRDVWPPEVQLRVSRVYGQALANVAAAEVSAFRQRVEPRLRASSDDGIGALGAIHAAFAALLPLADPLLLGIHRRQVELEIAQAAVRAAERRTASGSLPGAIEVTLAFCDLKDFTSYADRLGDAKAIEAIEDFATVVSDELGDSGRVVKALGDGYMLSFPDPDDAVAACLRIIARMQSFELSAHVGVHVGPALYREGDYFGRTVNLAARILELAGRDELIATEAVAKATSEAFEWEPAGARRVRGVSEPVSLSRIRTARATA